MGDELPQRPTADDRDAWRAYWTAMGMPWRTEPEIDAEQQHFLAERRAITPDIERGIYPFRDGNGSIKLTRADVEWLLATHEDNRGPIRWSDEAQRDRLGLDLRGGVLSGSNLSSLPLANLRAGLTRRQWLNATSEQREMAVALVIGTDLHEAHLEGASLVEAHAEGANLHSAHLEGCNLGRAWIAGADMRRAYLDSATDFENTLLSGSSDKAVWLADVHWNGANLSVVKWELVGVVGDELRARQRFRQNGARKDAATRLDQFQAAVRANRQLATELRFQGLNEHADRFAYRAQVLQRQVLKRQGRLGAAFGSWLLDAVAGYGYKPMRSVWTYVAVILTFAAAYFSLTNFGIAPFLLTRSTPLAWYEALVLSVGSFHGRGLYPTGLNLGDPVAILAAAEAIIGLLIEITFIATFTQRFFAR